MARFWRNEAEKKNEKKTPTAVKMPMIARQYAIARPGRLPLALAGLPLLDEEVDRDRHHRPDAGHDQGEQPAQRRGEQERDQPLLRPLGDLADGGSAAAPSRRPRRRVPELRSRLRRRGRGRRLAAGRGLGGLRAWERGRGATAAATAGSLRRAEAGSLAPLEDVDRHVGQRPLARREARALVADLVAGLAPQGSLARRGVGRGAAG